MCDSKLPDIVFVCRKCEHNLFLAKDEDAFLYYVAASKLIEIMNMPCPNCGEEGYTNWILCREGNYEAEYGGDDRTMEDKMKEEKPMDWEHDLRESIRQWMWNEDCSIYPPKHWGVFLTEVVYPIVGHLPMWGTGKQHGQLIDVLRVVSEGIDVGIQARRAESERRRRARI